MQVEQEVIETKRENENLQTVVDTLKQQNKNLQIEKDTEVESLSNQVGRLRKHANFCHHLQKYHLQFPQVSSLNARAAHTQNQQLTLVQEENKKLISERTVLQTQVRTCVMNTFPGTSEFFMFSFVCRSPKPAMKRRGLHTT